MAYCTLDDLIERAGLVEIRQVADRDRDGTPDPDVIDAAIDDAGNLIDGYIATRYDTPLPAVPRLVSTWAVSIARYLLHRNGAPDHVAQDYKDAIAALKDVQAGKLALPVTPGVTPPVEQAGRVLASHPDPVFTADRLRGWR